MTDRSTQIIRRVASLVFLVVFLYGQDHRDAVRPFTGIDIPGGRVAGLGTAFTGIADDVTALFYNPAGLAHLTKSEINLGLANLGVTTDVSGENATETGAITATRMTNAGFVLPIHEVKLTVAIGYHQLKAFERLQERTYISDSSSAIKQTLTEEGSIGAWSLGMGYQVSPMLTLGGAVDFLTGTNVYTNTYSYISDTIIDSAKYVLIEPEYNGVGLTLGILMSPWPVWRIGLLLRSPQLIEVNEKFDNGSGTDWPVYEYTIRSSYSVRLGSSLTLGCILISSDIYWFDYSQIRFKSDYTDNTDIIVNDALRTQYTNALGYAVGAELLLPVINAKLRGGYHSDPPIEEDAPRKMTQNTISFGLSVVPVPQIKMDAAYSLTTWQRDHSDGALEDISVNQLAVNIIYRF